MRIDRAFLFRCIAIAHRFRAARFDRVGEGAERAHDFAVADLVVNGLAPALGAEDAGLAELPKMPGDDGEIDIKTAGNLTHGAWPPALGEAGEQGDAVRVGEGAEGGQSDLVRDDPRAAAAAGGALPSARIGGAASGAG